MGDSLSDSGGGQVGDSGGIGPFHDPVTWYKITYTVEALLTDTLVSRQLYLRPRCLKPRFNSHTNSVFLHSCKRTFP